MEYRLATILWRRATTLLPVVSVKRQSCSTLRRSHGSRIGYFSVEGGDGESMIAEILTSRLPHAVSPGHALSLLDLDLFLQQEHRGSTSSRRFSSSVEHFNLLYNISFSSWSDGGKVANRSQSRYI